MTRFARLVVCLVVALSATTAFAQSNPLSVISSSPHGELSSLAQTNEIRVVFSEPMVVLGRIPDRVVVPFFKIAPAVPGTFRWSGTTVLIFTPDPERPLPYATTYEVTIAPTATAVSGRKLAKEATFRFTTPTVKLLSTNWYRRGGTFTGALVIALRFNQPVRSRDVAAAARASLQAHSWTPPGFLPEEEERLKLLDPQALDRFHAKVQATHAVVTSTGPVSLRIANDWDQKAFPPAPDLVVLETTAPVAPESWVLLTLSPQLRSPAGPAVPGNAQVYTIKVEHAFFIYGFRCSSECDADRRNPIKLAAQANTTEFGASLTATDITGPPRAVAKRATPRPGGGYRPDSSSWLTLEDAGFDAQPPNRKYMVAANASLKSTDGQTLGYTWLGIVDNWHMRASISFGDGHGVWEKDGGALLPFYARNMQDVTQWAAPIAPTELMPTILSARTNRWR